MGKLSEIEIAAFHEAGHAVAEFLFGRPFPEKVWIDASGNGMLESESWWRFHLQIAEAVYPKDRAMYEMHKMGLHDEVRCQLAGPIAEWKCQGKRLSGTLTVTSNDPGSDLNKSWHILTTLAQVECGHDPTEHDLFRTQFLNSLLQIEITNTFRKDRRPWKAVTALAGQLLTQQVLPGEAIDDICQENRLKHGEKAYWNTQQFKKFSPKGK